MSLTWLAGKRRKLRRKNVALRRILQPALETATFTQAIERFRNSSAASDPDLVLILADAITETACLRGEQEIYDQAEAAITILFDTEVDPDIRRELAFYLREIASSREICQQAEMNHDHR